MEHKSRSMHGKTVLISGANGGIGKVTSAELARRGARVVMACRRPEAAEQAMQDIRAQVPEADLQFVALDLADLSRVRQCVDTVLERFPRIDVLINNAGLGSMERKLSADGFELTLATNHLGPFALTMGLLPALRRTCGRIITVSSILHHVGRVHWDDLNLEHGYFIVRSYAQSKLCNVLFTKELARRVADDGISVNCLHPGVIDTGIWPEEKLWEKVAVSGLRLFMVDENAGAQTSIYLASSDAGRRYSGKYFANCRVSRPALHARSEKAQKRLFELSQDLTGLNLRGVGK